MRKTIKSLRARKHIRSMANDPRSYFYGDPVVSIDPDTAAQAISEGNTDVSTDIVAEAAPTEATAIQRAEAYQNLSPDQKAQMTLLPPLAVWNAQVIQNPVVGKLSAANLNYNLTKIGRAV